MKTKKSSYFVSFSERLLSYFYPIFLLVIEWFLRFAFQLDTQAFIGPTLTATSIGMTISLTTFKSNKGLSEDIIEQVKRLEEKGVRIETSRSIIFRNSCFLITLFLTIVWISTLVISVKFTGSKFWKFPLSYFLGLFCYFIGFITSEIKEFV